MARVVFDGPSKKKYQGYEDEPGGCAVLLGCLFWMLILGVIIFGIVLIFKL